LLDDRARLSSGAHLPRVTCQPATKLLDE